VILEVFPEQKITMKVFAAVLNTAPKSFSANLPGGLKARRLIFDIKVF